MFGDHYKVIEVTLDETRLILGPDRIPERPELYNGVLNRGIAELKQGDLFA
jgi:hypothetical protein